MNNDIIIQTMTESFEALKDSWETKKESIIKCIVETEACDGALAMDMWGYILEKNESLLKDKNENVHFIDDVILGFNEKYEISFQHSRNICKTIINHIAPHLVKNDSLIKIIFGNLINAGYSIRDYGYPGNPSELIPACIGCLFLQDYPQAIPVLLKALSNNQLMEDIRIGELVLKANFYLDVIKKNADEFDNYIISDNVKESLLSCLDYIKDKEDRAEIALSFLSR